MLEQGFWGGVIAKAFAYAHAADPEAMLIYNDYNNELEGKRQSMIRLIESLRAQKIPVHAIGHPSLPTMK